MAVCILYNSLMGGQNDSLNDTTKGDKKTKKQKKTVVKSEQVRRARCTRITNGETIFFFVCCEYDSP